MDLKSCDRPTAHYLLTGETLPPSRPVLEWCVTRPGKVNAISRVDVLGKEAFKRAGLYAFAAPSDSVRIFVFLPDGARKWSGVTSWRYEAWFVSACPDAHDHECSDAAAGADKYLVRHIVPRRECITADVVEALAAAENATRMRLMDWLGALR